MQYTLPETGLPVLSTMITGITTAQSADSARPPDEDRISYEATDQGGRVV